MRWALPRNNEPMKSTVTCTPVLSRPAPVVEAVHLNLTLNRLDARKLIALVGVCEYVGITKQIFDALHSAGLPAELTGQPNSLLRHTTDPHARVSLKFREAEAEDAKPVTKIVGGVLCRPFAPGEAIQAGDKFDSPFSHLSPEVAPHTIGVVPAEGNRAYFWRPVNPAGEGYRLLQVGERLQEGDEMFYPGHVSIFTASDLLNGKAIKPAGSYPFTFGYYRRPIANKYQELFEGDVVLPTDEVNHKSNPKELQEPRFGGWVRAGKHPAVLDLVGKPVSSTDWGVFRRLTGGAK